MACINVGVVPSRELKFLCYISVCLIKSLLCTGMNPDNLCIRMGVPKPIAVFDRDL